MSATPRTIQERRELADQASQSAQISAVSRLPKHKRADRENGSLSGSPRRIELDRRSETRRLGTKPGLKFREELVEDEDEGRRSVSWGEATRRWREWLREARNTVAVFRPEDGDEGDEVTVPAENRFMEKRQKQLYAKLKDVERGAREEYGEALNTALLTFTASNKSGAGDWWRTPANHLDDLLGSWPAVRRQLHRVLEGRDWEYARMLEPHKTGYAHVHLAVFVRGPINREAFRPVMEAHTDHCLPASPEAHRVSGEGAAVSIEGDVSNVGAYLSSYVMKWGEDPLDAPEHEQRFNALLWGTGRRRWSLSQGAQEWAALDLPESDSDLDLVAFEIAGERYPNNDAGEGVVMLSIDGDAGLDPPPDRGAPPRGVGG